MFTFIKNWLKKPVINTKPISIFEQALIDLDSLNPYSLKRVYSSDFSILTINVPVNNILSYIRLLEKAIQGMDMESGLFKIDFQFEPKSITVDQFFLTEKGYYLDNVIEIVSVLFSNIRSFLVAYQRLSESEICSPVNDHNRRILTPLARNVIDIVNQFKRI